MDSVTTTIVAALVAGVSESVTNVGKKVIVDAYRALKDVLREKFGGDSSLVQAVKNLEVNPGSEGRKLTLAEEVVAVKADLDPDVLRAVQELKSSLQAQGVSPEPGSVIASGAGSVAARNINNSTIRTNSSS